MTKPAAPTEKYVARAKAFAEAIDLAISVRKAALGPKADARMTKFEKETKAMVLNPQPAFAKLASLKYLEAAFFTYWNESSDPHVTRFWREVGKRKLPFHRRDWAKEPLARGRITSQVEYEVVTDAIGDDRFSNVEKAKLDSMLGAYGTAASKRARRVR